MNVRRALRWFRDRLAAIADAGRLSVRVGTRFLPAEDGADVDAWLIGAELPSRARQREHGAALLAGLGVDVG